MSENQDATKVTESLPVTSDSTTIVADDSTEEIAVGIDDNGMFGGSVLSAVTALPDAIRDYLLSDELAAVFSRVFDEHKVDEEAQEVVYLTVLQVFTGDLEVEGFPEFMWARMDWPDEDEARAMKLALDLLGNVFLPAQAFIGDVMELIIELGGKPEQYQVKPLEIRQVAYEEGIRKIMELIVLPKDFDDAARKRLEHIISSLLREVRDENDTRNMLTKEKKTGGLAMLDADADKIMAILHSEMRMTKFVEEVIETVHAEDHEGETSSEPHKEYSPEEIRSIYFGDPEEQKELARRVEEIKENVGDDMEALRSRLYDAMYPVSLEPPDRWDVVATLLSVAQEGDLIGTVLDERFKEVLNNYLAEKESELKASVEAAHAGHEGMNLFLQLALRGFAAMDENDSARYGLRITNMLKKQGEAAYADLVAFDLDKGEFAWTTTIEM